jgi:hypothetical protein
MKKTTRFLSSIVLMALVATALYATTGLNPAITLAALLTMGFVKGLTNTNFSPNNVALDGFVINDTTYAGEAAAGFILKAVTGNDTVQGGHIYIQDGIKKKYTIPRFSADYEDFIQDRAATPVSKGDMVVDGAVLEPQDYMIYTEFNPRDYEAHWFATMMEPKLIDARLPVSIESVVAQEVLKRHDRFLNKLIWNGDTTLTTIYKYINGLKKKALAANTGSDQTNIVSSPTTLSTSNIFAELARGTAMIPVALRRDPNMKIFMNQNTAEIYYTTQKNQTNKGVDITQRGIATFDGYRIVEITDLPDNFFMIAKGTASRDSNLWLGLNSTDDETTLKISPLAANSELWFLKLNMKVDVQFGWYSETVVYGS